MTARSLLALSIVIAVAGALAFEALGPQSDIERGRADAAAEAAAGRLVRLVCPSRDAWAWRSGLLDSGSEPASVRQRLAREFKVEFRPHACAFDPCDSAYVRGFNAAMAEESVRRYGRDLAAAARVAEVD